MKTNILIIILLMAGVNMGLHAQTRTSKQEVVTPQLAQKREDLKKLILKTYLGIKNSLVISDAQKTAGYAREFSNALGQFKFKKLSLEEMNTATTARESIKKLASQISETKDINEQRKYMEKLSEQFWTIADKVKPENTILYQQKCPMMGTTWVSDEKKIENPYYPKNMLTCGEVIAEK
ncbi:uncharacterized protein DUF3347 [Pedobacter psychrotolerans]|uniref:Uncharacterized protein DUF3347 n=1 Tax=Pedobacter psychrotolerans TaxID=1843235 RepID=A0A4R2H627_9SPHI|nr:DUF3347 domain-containing protein [Pedobacter psychrotolerans]TCO21477.1 uncharacterized protein DUF3347 [Pedobacter psychrotolerans]GGE38955.1 hypothetical protein GCM10011413_00640 [Pedobacter psychrotolerans]